jgi:nicotinate phosphoribosyltransferase
MAGDIITLIDAPCDGAPLLKPVMRKGRVVEPYPTLDESKAYARRQLESLPPQLKALRDTPVYPVQIAAELIALADSVDAAREQSAL